uniref:Phospholipid/glycerol acyltransferase domain-containing protein n=1 Tax=Kalanchoe fedtschenkoi TaxID=63787 RepID=A0A7N0V5Y1_KALFE
MAFATESDPKSPDSCHKSDNPPSEFDPSPSSSPTAQLINLSIEELEAKCAAYVRKDAYGTMGLGKLGVWEKVKLGIAMVSLVPLRVVLSMTILVVYYLICRACTMFKAPERGGAEEEEEEGSGGVQEDYAHMGGWRRAVVVGTGRFLSRAILFVFGFYWIDVTVVVNQDETADTRNQGEKCKRPGAIISNHVSYLDILYHMSSAFPSFVAKRSVAKLPLVGLISKCLGCVFVQRESKSSNFKGVSGVVTERVRKAHQNKDSPMMMLFPEGTTTNGDYLLPFKTGAFLSKAPVLPVILRYPYRRFSPAWDTISGARHIFLLLCQFVNYIEVKELPVYYPSEEEKENPKLYAENVRNLMAKEGNLTLSDIGLAEKRVYHAALSAKFGSPRVSTKDD